MCTDMYLKIFYKDAFFKTFINNISVLFDSNILWLVYIWHFNIIQVSIHILFELFCFANERSLLVRAGLVLLEIKKKKFKFGVEL